ncbi:MAG: exodeoxyribonuclease I [Candidatus Margulisbacteria bacterium]|nr:exodeoxyribonuclease I [Candidatus Margulisiibacteriota bacterium]
MTNSYLFYDLETFGTDPRADRIAQFAALRTDKEFNPLEDPIVLYCKIPPDYLPDIEACLISRITPQKTLQDGLVEYEFVQKIYEEFCRPDTCILGYNNIRFDDEFIRNAFYHNLLDPYVREYADGNSRWDLIDVVRATHDLRPDGINWPNNGEDKPSFRLQDLTAANNIEHTRSHDALSDVHAVISLAGLIREKQPKLFNYFLNNHDKTSINKLIKVFSKEPFVHTSRMLATDCGCTSVMCPLIVDPKNSNYILCFDLRYSPDSLISLPSEELKKLIFISKDEPEFEDRVRIKGIYTNKSPIVAPISVLTDADWARLSLDKQSCLDKFNKIMENMAEISEKLKSIYSIKPDYKTEDSDPELQIYSGGFFSDQDRTLFQFIHENSPDRWLSLNSEFEDPRLPTMLWRMIARNYPEILSDEDKNRWEEFRKQRLDGATSLTKRNFVDWQQDLDNRIKSSPDPQTTKILEELKEYLAASLYF